MRERFRFGRLPGVSVEISGKVGAQGNGVGAPRIAVEATLPAPGWVARWQLDPITYRPAAPTFRHAGRRAEPSSYVRRMARWSEVAPAAADQVEGALSYYSGTWNQVRELAATDVEADARRAGFSQQIAQRLADKVFDPPGATLLAVAKNGERPTGIGSGLRMLHGWGIDPAKLASSSSRGRRARVDPATVAELRRAGTTPTQIARQLDVPAGTVRSVLSRAGLKSPPTV